VLSTEDLVQRRDGPCWIRELDDDERYANAGTSYGPVSVSLCLSVTSQSAVETAEGIKLVFGLGASILLPSFSILHCVKRKFGYLQKLKYFPPENFPKLGT